jgi:Major capsid protein Gp23
MISRFKFFHGVINTKFTVHWNPEVEQDLNFYHGIDAENELTRIMSEEIARTIDEEIIQTITRRINGGMRA